MSERDRFDALFDPRGILVAGVSTHPGKFGFVSLHNILASGYAGAVHGSSREPGEVLGIPIVADLDDLPGEGIDLVFVCTPAAANADLLRACAKKGIRAAFLASGGYGEAGPDGERLQAELIALAEELGMVVAGPNGQGVVSTPAHLCAQIVAPYPPEGRIGIASQSGNFVSSFMNFAVQTGIGVSRAVSAGNAAAVTIPDYLDYYARDDATDVALAYVEGVPDGRTFFERTAAVAERKPLVLVKGGATAGGQRAAASHTGSLASDDRVFDGMCRQAGITRATTIEEAYEAAATFATQPLPRGNRVVVLTTAGGWGVVTADAISRSSLDLTPLPDDLRAALDEKLPPRWSRNNPVDLAGAETRDTIPEVIDLIVGHPDVDALLYLGLGIQSNQAALMRSGPFYPDHGLERIVDYHERQDARFAQAAADASDRYDKPVLTATELAVTHPGNAGPVAVRASGRLCYASANRAVTALDHLWRRARHRQARSDLVTRWLYRLLVLLLVIGLVGAGALVWSNEAGTDAAGSDADAVPAGSVTPVLSVRRVPAALAAPVAERRLARSLDALAATLPADTCIAVQGPDVGYGHRATSPVVPASTQKLVTATAALDAVGGDTRLRTAAVAGAPPAGGVVAGDLTLVGGGDPLLATPDYVARFRRQPQPFTDLGTLAQAVFAAGVRRVEGSVVGDERRYDTARSVADWPPRYLDQRQAGPLSALSLNDGFEQYPTPEEPGAPVEPAAEPAQAAAARFTTLLEAAGVEVVGDARAGAAPAGAVEVGGVDSAPLYDIVAQLLQESDNNTGELLLKEVGHDAGDPSTPGGAAAATAVLGDGSVDATGVRVADGSGLSVENRVTCDLLVDLFAREGTGPALQDRLAVAGESGTLEGRFEGTPLAGTLRGKTGSLNTVRSLAGVVEDDDPPLLFSMVVNVPEGQAMPASAVSAQQALGEALLAWPQVPDAGALGPVEEG